MMTFNNGNIELSNSKDKYANIIYLEEGGEFELQYLNPLKPSNKGASSNVFVLIDPSKETEDRVIKICKTPLSYTDMKSKGKISRFKREIRAFNLVIRNKIPGVIQFYGSGEIEIANYKFLYIVLEKADCDLADFLKMSKFNFTINQRLNFCSNIVNNFEKLHQIGIYHRDVKHDNIFCIEGEFKIGDLGLVTFRDRDHSMDYDDEKIGPFGWLSPEATNKMLSKNNNTYRFDCIIDDKSDVFQLGKLFWYIFQGNLPIGQLKIDDCKFNDVDIYNIIELMLQHNKERRPAIAQIQNDLLPIKRRLLI